MCPGAADHNGRLLETFQLAQGQIPSSQATYFTVTTQVGNDDSLARLQAKAFAAPAVAQHGWAHAQTGVSTVVSRCPKRHPLYDLTRDLGYAAELVFLRLRVRGSLRVFLCLWFPFVLVRAASLPAGLLRATGTTTRASSCRQCVLSAGCVGR